MDLNSPLLFIPLAIYLLVTGCGTIGLALATVLLNKARAAQPQDRAAALKPPLLPGALPPSAAPSGCRVICLKSLFAVSLGMVLLGLAGIWSAKPSLGWASNTVVEWSDGRARDLEPLIRKHCVPFLRAGKSVGLAVAVAERTNTLIMTFGRPSIYSAAPVCTNTLFEIGSITKTFTGLALARETECGAVSLDQPVQELLPAGVQLPEAARAITLRQLTTHSSGLPRLAANAGILPGIKMLLFGSNPYGSYTEADLLAALRTVDLEFKPGTKRAYSNFGMMLLGYLLATKAGVSFEELIHRDVCHPLGMNQTTSRLDRAQADRLAQGYRAVVRWGPLVLGLRAAPWFQTNNLGGAGALHSTPADMLKYLQANQYPDGNPIEQALRQSHRELFKEDERMASGMNWVRTQGQTLKQTVIWHNGGTGGFRSFLGFAERSRVGVVVLSNSSESVDELATDLLRELVETHSKNTRDDSPPKL